MSSGSLMMRSLFVINKTQIKYYKRPFWKLPAKTNIKYQHHEKDECPEKTIESLEFDFNMDLENRKLPLLF